MALVSCKECGLKIASSAKECPHCGAPIRKSPLVKILGACIFITTVYALSTKNSDPVQSTSEYKNKVSSQIDLGKTQAVPAPVTPAPQNPEKTKQVERMEKMKPLSFCSVELRKLKGKKSALPPDWFDALNEVARHHGIKGDQLVAIQEGGVLVGMNTCAALAAWGRPDRVNTTTRSSSVSEQWVYSRSYLYFQDGVLTTIQN